MGGSLISGIFMMDGLGGRLVMFIPPRARGIYGTMVSCCLNTFSATMGAFTIREGILLMVLGLFSASSR
jgi:hypothetical protein